MSHTLSTDPGLHIQGLGVSYYQRGRRTPAVTGVDLSVQPGMLTALVGESGSGKSTTAMAALGLLPKGARREAGELYLSGTALHNLNDAGWRAVRGARIGLIPQDPNNSLNPVATIGASLVEALAIHGRGTPAAREQRALALLEEVGIDDPARRFKQYPHELSGGMKQRVLIAAAVALEPEIIIADEPTSALDATVQKTILDVLERLCSEHGVGVLFITHDLTLARQRAERIVVMREGTAVDDLPPAKLNTSVASSYTRQLLSDAPSFRPGAASRPRLQTETLLEVDGLVHDYEGFRAVDGVSLSLRRGETHAIVGESGSGKTTTGQAIAGFVRPTAGRIRLGELDVTACRGAQRRALRKAVQVVYQNPLSSLDPRWPVWRSIAEPARALGVEPRRTIRQRVAEVMEQVALDPNLAERRPAQLSGGQRQRVAIARAIIARPQLLVLDEPVSALDVTVQARILRLLEELQQQLGLAYLFISHDLAVVQQLSDTVTVLRRGRIMDAGHTTEVFAAPQSDYTRELIAAAPRACVPAS